MRSLFPFLLFALFAPAACGPQAPSTAAVKAAASTRPTYTKMAGADDVYLVRGVPATHHVPNGDVAACRAHIAAVICHAQDMEHLACQEGGETYAKPFEELFDHYPVALQKMFCSVDQILVLDKFVATAFAGNIVDADGHVTGAQLGIRRSLLDARLSLAQWATWKEELNFGGHTDSYDQTPGLPEIATHTDAQVYDFLYFTITHEFGHMFDFANDLNKFLPATGTADANAPKVFAPESWGALSWTHEDTVIEANRFPYRKNLCFYGCDGEPMTRAAVLEAYRGLARTNFLSMYAATNPYDDLADSLAYYMSDKNLGTSYEIHTRQGENYDIIGKLHGDVFATKRQYLADFLARPEVNYP